MIESGTRVGGYVLDRAIKGGSVGQIWRARADSSPGAAWQALKLLKPLQEGEERRDFHREVYALAKLRHPNVAHVSDVGVWHHEQERYPFLVMEFIEGDTFRELANKRVSWRVWYELIMDVLHALSHAHAVGVVHRDIKPANILVELDGRGHRMAKLVDFGVARIVRSRLGDTAMGMTLNAGRSTDGVVISGTPRYMAPEQIDPRCGTIGPWTDLYAVGCMIWRLLCMKGPFDGELYHILASHLTKAPGVFEPVVSVPPGLEAWLRWLMHKNPYERCRHAEHAAASLAPLVNIKSTTSRMPAVMEWGSEETSISQPRRTLEQLRAMVDAEEALHIVRKIRPSLPVQWDARTAREHTASLDSLVHPVIWRRRPHQLVGRRAERDVLWGHLHQVIQDKKPVWVSLSGSSGVGKSHLQNWFERYVRELGVAQVLSLSCSHYRRGKSVVVELIRNAMLLKGFDGEVLREEFYRFFCALGFSEKLARLESAQFTALLSPSGQDVAHEIQDHEALFIRFLSLLCAHEPVVLSLHGLAHHPSLAEKIVQHFNGAIRRSQPLMVLTVAPELLDYKRIKALGNHFDRLPLQPLSHALQCRALASMLPLDRGSLQMLVARTKEDLPLAVMHLHKWVHEGVFVQRSQDFKLESSMLDQIASSHQEFWTQWLTDWSRQLPTAQLMGLEIAALMEEVVHEHLWVECCTQVGANALPLFERMLDLGVARGLGLGTWKFTQETPRFLLNRQARATGRAKAHHETIATVFESCGSDDPIFAERAAEHWIKASRFDEALHIACVTGERHAARSDLRALKRIIDLLRSVAESSRQVRERAQVYASLFSMVLALRQKNLEEARELASLCMAMARLNGWSDVRARVQLELAVWHEHQGHYMEAFEQLEQAQLVLCDVDVLKGHHDGILARRLLRYKAHLLITLDRSHEALHVLDDLAEQSVRLEGSHEQALAMMTRSHALQQIGELEEARGLLDNVFAVFERAGDRQALTVAMNRYAELVQHDDLAQSRSILENVLALLDEDEQMLMLNTKLRLALTCMQLEDLGTADVLLQDILEHVSPKEHIVQCLVALLARGRCAWGRGHQGLTLSMVSQARELLHMQAVWYERADEILVELLTLVSPEHGVLRASLEDCRVQMAREKPGVSSE